MMDSLLQTANALTTKLLSLGEHIPVQAHLAGMEAADAIATLTKEVQNAVDRVTGAGARINELTEEGRYQAELAVLQAKDGWAALKGQIEKIASAPDGQTGEALIATKDTLITETQALVDMLEDGVKALASRIPH